MGKLYVVPTPVGNLEDITLRALKVLKECDLILAEDTRTSGFLLKHYGIDTHMQSHHKFNEHHSAAHVVERLKQVKTLRLSLMLAHLAYPIPVFCLYGLAYRKI